MHERSRDSAGRAKSVAGGGVRSTSGDIAAENQT